MRVFVTGVTGQVGRAILQRLFSAGYDVIGTSRSADANPNTISEHISADLSAGKWSERIVSAVRPCEAIIHCAASVSYKLADPSIALTNCWGTQQVVQLSATWNVRQVIYLSSVPVIGVPRILPITEEHPVQPLTAYHASKLYGEYVVALLQHNGCVPTVFRLTSACGSGTPSNRIVAAFVRRALAGEKLTLLGRGGRRQNYVDVRDIANAVALGLEKRVPGIFNIAGAMSLSNCELANACIEEFRSSSSVEFSAAPDPDEDIAWDVSIERAGRELGYSPQFTIPDMIRTVAYGCPDYQ